jgi:hypothetical protein
VKDANGALINCTGYVLAFTARKQPAATSTTTDTDATITGTIAGQASGIHTLTLSAAQMTVDPYIYLADIQVKKNDGTIHSSRALTLEVTADITRGA